MSSVTNKHGAAKRFGLLPRLLCLVFAFMIWIYVMMVDSPDYEETFENIPITLVGTTAIENEKNLSVFSGSDVTVDITVKGQKSVISRYSTNDIKVNADVSNVTKAGVSTVKLFFDLPGDLSVVSASAETVDLFIDSKVTANVDVNPRLSSYKVAADYEIGQISCDTPMITVTGPASIVGDIDHALVDVNMGDSYVSESMTTDCSISLMNSNDEPIESRYLKLSQTSVNVNVPVFAYKVVSLQADYKYGLYNSDNSSITFSPSNVRIKGDPKKLASIDSIYVTTIDEKTIREDVSLLVDIPTPDGISLADDAPTCATVHVKLLNLTKRAISVRNIVVDYDKDMKCDVITNAITVVIMANSDKIMDISSSDITLYADLTVFKGSSGTVQVPVEVQINNSTGGTVYELGDYNIQVNVGS